MLTWIRERFGKVVISSIIGLITLVFVFSGIMNPKRTRGMGEGAVAGEVNGEPITISEFSREYNRRLEFFKQMGGGKLSEEQLSRMGIKGQVFQELARRKLLVQEATSAGLPVSDEEVRDKIRAIPAFQKEGKFDVTTYKQVLSANNYAPGGFERMIREDLLSSRWEDFFRTRVKVSEEEIRTEFELSQNKRTVKYVLLTPEMGQKAVVIPAADVQAYAKNPAKQSLMRSRYEQRKATDYKGLSFEVAQDTVARDLLAAERVQEVQKALDGLATQTLSLLSAEASSDKKIKESLKKVGAEARTSAALTAQNRFVPGLGEAGALLDDAFSGKLAQPKKYVLASGTVVALVIKSESPDPLKFAAEREKLARSLATRKERTLFESWLRSRLAKSKIDANPSVVGNESEI